MQFGLRDDIRRGRRRIDRGQRLRRGTRRLRKACFQQRHRPLDETEDQPFGGEGATEHQRQFPGYIEQLIVSRGIVGGSHDPVIERRKVRQRPRHIGDLVRDLADLLGHRQQQLGAEAVRSQRDRRMRCGRGWRGLRLRRGIGDRAQRIDHLRALVVVLQRIERPLGLIGRQHIGVVVAGAAASGAAPVWAKAGKANKAQASRIDGNSLCDTKAPLNICARQQNRNRYSPSRMRLVGSPLFAVIVCRKFATAAAFSWHLPGICRTQNVAAADRAEP